MPRLDLLSLTTDDLATLANRGLVKRAQTELDAGQIEYTLSENKAGTVSVLWSDDIHCLLPSNVPLQSAKCSCPATTLCRHLIRSVLAYQREYPEAIETVKAHTNQESEAESQPESVSPTPIPQPPASSEAIWNPAEISDEDLAKILSPSVLTKARKIWESGLVIETKRGARPSAWFHTLGVNLRFLVPHDARYTHCDCAEAPPCLHVPLAIWAFRELAKDVEKGLISTNLSALPVPIELLDSIENTLSELAQTGVSGVERTFIDRLKRLENECRAQGLIWPAEIVAELSQQIEWYLGHNARFEAQQVASLVGELLIRCDAIRADTGAVPALFVRGASTDKMTEVGAARLIGIGTHARTYAGGVEIKAFLQDTDSGAVVVVARDYANPKEDANPTMLRGGNNSTALPLTSLAKLGASPVIKGVSIGSIGSGQILARGGKRAPSGLFSLGRTPISFNPQTFEWEKLRAPLLFDSFADLEAHLQQSAPATLRPRRMGEDIHVVKIRGVQSARFVLSEQQVEATLIDDNASQALLVHPYTSRGEEGVTALLETLQKYPQNVRFISGRFSRSKSGLKVEPLALVFQEGSTRRMIQPWVSSKSVTHLSDNVKQAVSTNLNFYSAEDVRFLDPLHDFQIQFDEALGELFLLGLQRADERSIKRWQSLNNRGFNIGYSNVTETVFHIHEELNNKLKKRIWDSSKAIEYLKEAAVLTRLLEEIV